MNKRGKAFNDLKIIGVVMVFLALFQTAGCSHITPVCIINYTDQDITFDEGFTVPKRDHLYTNMYLGGASGMHLKITSGKKVLMDRNVSREELDQKMLRDDLLVWEVKPQ